MNVLRIDHTAVVVRDMDEALNRYQTIFGLKELQRSEVADQRVEVAFLAAGDTTLELVRPLTDDSGVARFLELHGESLHHIGVLVNDIRSELQSLERDGVELIDREPRQGVHGSIAFVHPRATGGVLVELVEHRRDDVFQA
jgi:methylmalonyl-CoA/ethylmalonyl-CoA epimerase